MIYEKSGCGACGSNKCYIQNFEYMFVMTKGKITTYNLIYDRPNVIVGKKRLMLTEINLLLTTAENIEI